MTGVAGEVEGGRPPDRAVDQLDVGVGELEGGLLRAPNRGDTEGDELVAGSTATGFWAVVCHDGPGVRRSAVGRLPWRSISPTVAPRGHRRARTQSAGPW